MPALDLDLWHFQDSNASASLSLQSSRVQVPKSLSIPELGLGAWVALWRKRAMEGVLRAAQGWGPQAWTAVCD